MAADKVILWELTHRKSAEEAGPVTSIPLMLVKDGIWGSNVGLGLLEGSLPTNDNSGTTFSLECYEDVLLDGNFCILTN